MAYQYLEEQIGPSCWINVIAAIADESMEEGSAFVVVCNKLRNQYFKLGLIMYPIEKGTVFKTRESCIKELIEKLKVIKNNLPSDVILKKSIEEAFEKAIEYEKQKKEGEKQGDHAKREKSINKGGGGIGKRFIKKLDLIEQIVQLSKRQDVGNGTAVTNKVLNELKFYEAKKYKNILSFDKEFIEKTLDRTILIYEKLLQKLSTTKEEESRYLLGRETEVDLTVKYEDFELYFGENFKYLSPPFSLGVGNFFSNKKLTIKAANSLCPNKFNELSSDDDKWNAAKEVRKSKKDDLENKIQTIASQELYNSNQNQIKNLLRVASHAVEIRKIEKVSNLEADVYIGDPNFPKRDYKIKYTYFKEFFKDSNKVLVRAYNKSGTAPIKSILDIVVHT